MREQRKLAAVLAADVVGYSRLMGRDEAGTLARLPATREAARSSSVIQLVRAESGRESTLHGARGDQQATRKGGSKTRDGCGNVVR